MVGRATLAAATGRRTGLGRSSGSGRSRRARSARNGSTSASSGLSGPSSPPPGSTAPSRGSSSSCASRLSSWLAGIGTVLQAPRPVRDARVSARNSRSLRRFRSTIARYRPRNLVKSRARPGASGQLAKVSVAQATTTAPAERCRAAQLVRKWRDKKMRQSSVSPIDGERPLRRRRVALKRIGRLRRHIPFAVLAFVLGVTISGSGPALSALPSAGAVVTSTTSGSTLTVLRPATTAAGDVLLASVHARLGETLRSLRRAAGA